MRGASVLAAALVLLAGCSEKGNPDPAETSGTGDAAADTNSTILSTQGTFRSTATFLQVPSLFVQLEGGNCVVFERSVDTIRSGFVEASWLAAAPDVDQMRLVAVGAENREVTGPSPLHLDLAGLERFDGGLWLALAPILATGAMVQTPLELTWQFDDYDGSPDPAFQPSACGA